MFQRLRKKLRKQAHEETEPFSRNSVTPRDEVSPDQSSKVEIKKRNLWEIAFRKLDEIERKHLAVEKADPISKVLEGVIDHTKEKYGMYKKGDLQIRDRSISMRNSVKNIISFTLQAQDLINGIVSLDQTGYVSGPWSIVSFGLTLVKNDIERRDAIMEASEYLAGVLTYHAIIDNHYRHENTESNNGLENALIDVYTAILRYTAEVKRAAEEGIGTRIRKSITALGDEPLKRLKGTIDVKSEVINKWKTLNQDADQTRKAEQILADVDEVAKQVESVDSRVRSNEELEMLEWLSKASYSQTQNSTQDRRTTDTGDWFLQSQEYIQWRSNPGTMLWLHGAVGCGKSVLCSSIIKDVEKYCADCHDKKLAYWYFQFSNDESQNVDNMIRSLIRQLSPNRLPEYIYKLCEDRRQGRQPAKEKLLEAMKSLVDNDKGDVFLVFDALDECPARTLSGRRERDSLLTIMETLLHNHQDKIHILATSRAEPDIRSKLEKYTPFNLEDGLNQDVEKFIYNELEHGKLRIWKPSVHQKIRERLLNVSDRRFRWADLQIKRLEECHMEPDIIETLETIPDSLEETYRTILTQISKKYQGAARSILIWLSFSAVPLTLKQTAEVAGFPFESSVIEVCTTSMVTTNTDDTIKLAHFSVKEFLVIETLAETSAWYHFSTITGHHAILERAVSDLLSLEEFASSEVVKEERPLLMYTARYWDVHILTSEDTTTTPTPTIYLDIVRLFTEASLYENWLRLRYFSIHGQSTGMALEPPIYQSSKMGILFVVKSLLANGADPLDPFYDPLFFFSPRNALQAAAQEGHLSLLEFLLEGITQVPREVTWDILHSIDCRHHKREKPEAILKLLWNMGALTTEQNEIDEECVRRAVLNMNSGSLLMDILFDWQDKATFPLTDQILESVMKNADREAIMEVIFKHRGNDVPITHCVMEALSTLWNNELLVALVVKQWASILPTDQKTLCCFAKRGTLNSMQLLLPLYDDATIISPEMLIAAAQNRRQASILKYLLKKRGPGTSLNKDVYIAAAENEGNGLEIMRVLLDDCGPETYMGEEILNAVASNLTTGPDILKLFLQKQQAGFVVSETVLVEAASKNGEEMLQLLMNNAGSTLPSAKKLVLAAAGNRQRPDSVMEYFLNFYQQDFPITEQVLACAANNNLMSESIFVKILDAFQNFPIPDHVFEEAAVGLHPERILLLLDKNDNKLPADKIINRCVTGLYASAATLLKVLLDRQLIVVNEKTIEAVATNQWAVELFLNENPNVLVTERALLNAVQDGNADSLRLLLNRWNNDKMISEDTMKAATESREAIELFQLLLDRSGLRLSITESVLIHTARLRSKDILEMILSQQRSLDLQAVWEAIWQGDCCQKKAASEVMHKHAEIYVSESILEKMVGNSNSDFDDGFHEIPPSKEFKQYAEEDLGDYRFDGLIQFCVQRKVPMLCTKRAIEIILERCCSNAVQSFLEYQTNIQITADHLEMAMRNRRGDGSVLNSLLREKIRA